ncbi:hypothetical protein K8R32_04795, partial [bacterium]|nr:hypothetical protein [bacterium]
LVTRTYHRMPGYVGIYLGKTGKYLVFAAKMLGNYGALLAYLIISGEFLYELLNSTLGGSPMVYSTGVFIFSGLVVYFGIGMIARVELYMAGLLILVVGFMVVRGWGVIDGENFAILNWKYIFLPYGAMLLALDGNGSLPIVAKLMKKNPRAIRSVIRISMLLASLIVATFVFTIVGISGPGTTPNALSGVKAVLDDGVIILAMIFGIFSMLTSILGVSESVKETFWWDFKLPKRLSWALAVFIPYILYLLGINDLIAIISFAGAIAGGFCAIMLIVVFRKMKRNGAKLLMFKHNPGKALSYILITFLVLGLLYEVYYYLLA